MPQHSSSIERWTELVKEMLKGGVPPTPVYDRLRLEHNDFPGSRAAVKHCTDTLERACLGEFPVAGSQPLLPLAERALTVREQGDASATALAQARFLLARALIEAGEGPERALALAEQARKAYREGGSNTLAPVERWLAVNGGRATATRARATGSATTSRPLRTCSSI
jgi:hypothetical protein